MRYSAVAISLHWTIAAAIVAQLATGLWMVRAIRFPGSQALAFQAYQWHKSLGLTILVLSLLRICWRLANPPPPLPATMTRIERTAARTIHGLFYLLALSTPLVGWVIVSASPLGLPTMVFGLFEWPHIAWLAGLGGGVEAAFKTAHRAMGYAFVGLLILHVAAALKHHLIDRDDVLARMLPLVRRGVPAGSRSTGR
ncbi:MAG: cytochrome b [Hyphomicrobiaceae bacterium]